MNLQVFIVLSAVLSVHLCNCSDISTEGQRDPSFLRLMVMHYPHYPHVRPPEPFTYPGPSPPVKPPLRMPSLTEPYMFVQPQQNRFEQNSIPKWCKAMWEREECGMKCWMLRKICRNIAKQAYLEEVQEDLKQDSESSSSMSQAQYKPFVPFYSYYGKPKPTVTYAKTSVPNTYIAKPSWQYPHLRRASYYYKNPSWNAEIGLNPQFTYVEGHEKLYTTTEKAVSNETSTTPASINVTSSISTELPEPSTTPKITRKGVYPVTVKVVSRYPPDSEVTTLSPLMFEYDNLGKKGYYGDRIFMSAMMPVSDRQQRDDYSASYDSEGDDMDVFDDFDEMMIDP